MKILHTKFIVLTIFIFFWNRSLPQDNLGRWYSKTTLNQEEVHYLFDIRKHQGTYIGYLDIPSDNRFRVALDSISVLNGNQVFIQHEQLDLLFTGYINSEKLEISGKVSKDSLSNSLILSRAPQVSRTQIIEKPLPYVSKDVFFYNKDSTRLAGTVTIPKNGDQLKAVVLISGSGPQDRNEEILGHKPFAVLADHLTRQGIVVLRYDDRGYGQSEGQFRPATSRDYADDVLGAVQFLKNYEDVPISTIGLIGHSEGGNIAPMVATIDPTVSFLVLLAAPAPSNLQSYLVSLDLILKEEPENYDRDYPLFKSVYEDMARIENKEVLRDSLQTKFERLMTLMSEEELAEYGGAETYLKSLVNYHTSDWYHYYLRFNVASYLKELKIPILALNGDKDTSVEADFNLTGIETVLENSGNTQYETMKLGNVNHFFQVSNDAKIESVYFNQETFSKVALVKIGKWIKEL